MGWESQRPVDMLQRYIGRVCPSVCYSALALYANKATMVKVITPGMGDRRLHTQVLLGRPWGCTVLLWVYKIHEGKRLFSVGVKEAGGVVWIWSAWTYFWYVKVALLDFRHWNVDRKVKWRRELAGHVPSSDCMSLASLVYRPICQMGLSLTTEGL